MFDSILRLTGSARAASVFGAIWRYAQGSGQCYASLRTIAERVGLCRHTVAKYVAELTSLGLITTVARPGCPSLMTPAPTDRWPKPVAAVSAEPPPASPLAPKAAPQAIVSQPPSLTDIDRSSVDTGPTTGRPGIGQVPVQDLDTKRQLKRHTPAVPAGIRILRGICKRYPPKETWEFLSECIGPEPDRERLKECYVQWRIAGYKPTNYAWVSNWYRNGIPKHRGGRARPSVGTFSGSRIEE